MKRQPAPEVGAYINGSAPLHRIHDGIPRTDVTTTGEVNSSVEIEIDLTKCTGMGLCEITAPLIFEVGDDGQAHLLLDHLSADDLALAEEAVRNCPTMALRLQSDE